MLGALTFIAVRQHQGDAVDAAPLDLAGCDELVNHHLGTVGKITKLCFPDDQCVGVVRRVAVLESQHRFFRQDGVDDDKGCLAFRHILQGNVGTGVPLLTVLVVNDGMSVRERATTAVFTRQAHRVATGHQ